MRRDRQAQMDEILAGVGDADLERPCPRPALPAIGTSTRRWVCVCMWWSARSASTDGMPNAISICSRPASAEGERRSA